MEALPGVGLQLRDQRVSLRAVLGQHRGDGVGGHRALPGTALGVHEREMEFEPTTLLPGKEMLYP